MNDFVRLLDRLVSAPGISGFEDQVSEIVSEELRAYVDSVEIDSLCNVVGIKNGTSKDAPKVLVDAHIDQVGMTVKYVEPSGFLRVERQGYPLVTALPAQRVVVHGKSGPIKGVIGVKGAHFFFSEAGNMSQPLTPKLRDIYVDIGCESQESVQELGVNVGDPITFDSRLDALGSGKLVTGPAMDNRALVAVLIQTMKNLSSSSHEATIYVVGSAMEEPNLRGARGVTFRLKPDIFIAVDISVCADTPDSEFRDFPTRIGRGPIVTISDMVWTVSLSGMTAHPAIREHFINTAIDKKIPYQTETITGTVTNAAVAHEIGPGIPAGALKVPCRYTHTASEVVSLDDLKYCTELLTESLIGIRSDFSLKRPWKARRI